MQPHKQAAFRDTPMKLLMVILNGKQILTHMKCVNDVTSCQVLLRQMTCYGTIWRINEVSFPVKLTVVTMFFR